MESWMWLWKPLIPKCLSIFHFFVNNATSVCRVLLVWGKSSEPLAPAPGPAWPPSLCPHPLLCHPSPGLWFVGHGVVLNLGNFWAGSISKPIPSSLSQRWGPDAWWDPPHRCLIFGGKAASLLTYPMPRGGIMGQRVFPMLGNVPCCQHLSTPTVERAPWFISFLI